MLIITTQHQRSYGHSFSWFQSHSWAGPQQVARKNPAFKPTTCIWRWVTDLKSLWAYSLPKLQLLTVHTLCINDVLCSFSYCEIQRFAANFVHSPGVQGPLLLGASKGFNARIQLCKKQIQSGRTGWAGWLFHVCKHKHALGSLSQDYLICQSFSYLSTSEVCSTSELGFDNTDSQLQIYS